jgi:hypothetical protein
VLEREPEAVEIGATEPELSGTSKQVQARLLLLGLRDEVAGSVRAVVVDDQDLEPRGRFPPRRRRGG